MTTNADRQTPYEYETTDALIAEVRRLRADNIAPQSSRNRLVALTEQLADALEAAQAQVAELTAALEWESKPTDLTAALAKVREWAIVDEIHGGKRGDDPEWRGQSCLLCRRRSKFVIWEVGEPERHAPDCPAAPIPRAARACHRDHRGACAVLRACGDAIDGSRGRSTLANHRPPSASVAVSSCA